MPRARKIAAYPIEYFDLFQSALDHEEEVVIELPDKKEAHNTRLDLYSFRKSLELEKHVFARPSLAVVIRVEGNKVLLQGRDFTPRQLAVRQALIKYPPLHETEQVMAVTAPEAEPPREAPSAVDDLMQQMGYEP